MLPKHLSYRVLISPPQADQSESGRILAGLFVRVSIQSARPHATSSFLPLSLTHLDEARSPIEGHCLDRAELSLLSNCCLTLASLRGRRSRGHHDRRQVQGESLFITRPPTAQWTDWLSRTSTSYSVRLGDRSTLPKTHAHTHRQYLGPGF